MYIASEDKEGAMLKKEYVRDGKNRVIGSVTTGFDDESSVVRDEEGHILGAPATDFIPPAMRTATWFRSIRVTPVS